MLIAFLLASAAASLLAVALVRTNQYPEDNVDEQQRYSFGGPLLGDRDDHLSMDDEAAVSALMRQLFRPGRPVRSESFMLGTRLALGDCIAQRAIVNPYAVGSSEHDAFRAGAEYGYAFSATLHPQLTA